MTFGSSHLVTLVLPINISINKERNALVLTQATPRGCKLKSTAIPI